jgi:sugar/nucleoside kinase (ribokinase family)
MLDYVIYGKIIIDDIRLRDGSRVPAVLGGGGPQAAFGALLWSESVGLLTRSGTDLTVEQIATLEGLGGDLSGWRRYPDIPTPHTVLEYDAGETLSARLLTSSEGWTRLLSQPLSLPASFARPRAIHLITEFPDEPMVRTALALSGTGTMVSLEPLATDPPGANWEQMLALIGQVSIVSPDWPTASWIAKSDDPGRVLRFWSTLGPELVAVRHGARGSYVWSRERDEFWHVPAVRTEVIDPTGAGNAYGGALCVGWAETGDARRAAAYGTIAASHLVRQVGLPRMSGALRERARRHVPEAVAAARLL